MHEEIAGAGIPGVACVGGPCYRRASGERYQSPHRAPMKSPRQYLSQLDLQRAYAARRRMMRKLKPGEMEEILGPAAEPIASALSESLMVFQRGRTRRSAIKVNE